MADQPNVELDLPADVLPLVPVRNLVLFPGTVVPVTMARPRSIAAAQAGVRGERPIGVVLQREAGDRGSRPARPAPGRHHRQRPALHDRPGRQPSPDLPGPAALPHPRVHRRLPVPRRPLRAGRRARGQGDRDRGALHAPARAGARGGGVAAAGAARARRDDPLDSLARPARRPGRQHHGHQPEREGGGARDLRSRPAHRPGARVPQPAPGRAAPVARAGRGHPRHAGEAPARGDPARAAGDDQEGAGRGRGHGGRGRGPEEGDRRGRHARGGADSRPTRSCAGWSGCPRPRPSTACCAPISTP